MATAYTRAFFFLLVIQITPYISHVIDYFFLGNDLKNSKFLIRLATWCHVLIHLQFNIFLESVPKPLSRKKKTIERLTTIQLVKQHQPLLFLHTTLSPQNRYLLGSILHTGQNDSFLISLYTYKKLLDAMLPVLRTIQIFISSIEM